MPFVINAVTPNDETITRTLDIFGSPAEITYYRNRITLEPIATDGTQDEVAEAVAGRLCQLVAAWDFEGPAYKADGTLLVAEGEAVPIDPEVIKCLPFPLITEIQKAITAAEMGGNDRKRPKR